MIHAGSGPFGIPTLDEILVAIGGKVAGIWSGLWSPVLDAWPLAWSIAAVVGLVLACTAITVLLRMYFPDSWTKWLRIALGFVVFGAIPWLWGRVSMYFEMMARLKAERSKKTRR